MSRNRHEFVIFFRFFAKYVFFVRHVVIGLIMLIVLAGVLISYLENLPIGDAIYFAFITGLTIGYGDIEPVTTWGRVFAIVIGILGILFTGMTVAIATRALADTVKQIGEQSS